MYTRSRTVDTKAQRLVDSG